MGTGRRGVGGLYAIVDGGWCPAEGAAAYARRLLTGGCRLLQLRMKDAAPDARRSAAEHIAALKAEVDFTFIVNDDPELALAVGADGVHVGANDLSVRAVRERFGNRLLVGYSSHAIDEALRAQAEGADYVAFGAIYATPTKGPGHPVQGLERLRALADAIDVPLVAIGGITRETVDAVCAAGADAVALITALARAPDATAEAAWFVARCSRGSA